MDPYKMFLLGKQNSLPRKGLSCEPIVGKPHLHLAHLVIDAVRKGNLGDFPSEGRALAETKLVLHDFFQREDQIDDIVRPENPFSFASRAAWQPGMGYPIPQIFRRRVPQSSAADPGA